MSASCEHCGRSDERPIILQVGGKQRSFCSTDCLVSVGRDEVVELWRALIRERDTIVAKLERERESRVISLIHRQEMHNGDEQYITIDNTEELLRKIRSVPLETPIDFIIHCPGGVVLPAEQIALALKEHRGQVTAIVPYYAMSGATLVCLAADKILMEPFSVLGPLDPQIAGFPSPSLLSLVESKGVQFVSDQMIVLADIAEKSLRQMKSFIQHLLKGNVDDVKARDLAEYLTGGYLTHDSPLTASELRSLGLNIALNVPDEIHRFMKLHRLISTSSDSRRGEHGVHQDEPQNPDSVLSSAFRVGEFR